MKIKIVITIALICLANLLFCQNKAIIDKSTKDFRCTMDNGEYRIFGYDTMSIKGNKTVCISSFTSDVEGNPNKCSLGAYYSTFDIPNEGKIIYITSQNHFVKLKYVEPKKADVIFYIEEKMVEFE